MLGKRLLSHYFVVADNLVQRQTSKNTIQRNEHVFTLAAHPSLKVVLANLN